jgi:hypothetical protein
MDLIKLAREKRTADLVFNAATYATANKVTLSGNTQFSDFDNSDPIATISTALDGPIIRPNTAVFGYQVWSVLRRHPKLVQAIFGNNQSSGIISREQFASLFELQNVYIGQSYLNTAKKGQTVSLARVWGKHISFYSKNPVANVQGGTTFGFTARFGEPVGGEWEDKNAGMRGGTVVRAGESVKELIVAPELGYFIQNAVA